MWHRGEIPALAEWCAGLYRLPDAVKKQSKVNKGVVKSLCGFCNRVTWKCYSLYSGYVQSKYKDQELKSPAFPQKWCVFSWALVVQF